MPFAEGTTGDVDLQLCNNLGLNPENKITVQNSDDCTCSNCKRILESAGLAAAWRKTKKSLRVFYMQRAGFSPSEAMLMLRKRPGRWSAKQQDKIIRQLQSAPEFARAMGRDFLQIERGGSGDERRRYAPEWMAYQIRKRGTSCPHCGGGL